MAAVDTSPLGIPPHALLIVKRLAAGGQTSATPDARGDRLRLAMQSELSRVARLARRPWLDPTAHEAEAVLFIDEHELVACLTRDELRGAVSSRWWWRRVLGAMSVEQWLRQHVLARGEVLAPTLALLATQGQAVPWVAQLDSAAAMRATQAVARMFALPMADLWATPSPSIARRGNDGRGESAPPAPAASSPGTSGEITYLAATVPEVTAPSLTPAQRWLLGVTLATVRTPTWARTLALPRALRELELSPAVEAHDRRARAPASEPTSMHETAHSFTGSLTASRHVRESKERPGAKSLRGRSERERRDESAPPRAADKSTTSHEHRARHRRPTTLRARARQVEASPDIATVASETPALRAAVALPESPRREPRTAAIAQVATPVHVHTAFGGVFYLLNAFLALGLYGDFTAPRTPGLALSPWDLLALTGREWFGREFMRDPVWRTLAELAGRESGEPPGHLFEPPNDWITPDSWLAPWRAAGLTVPRVATRASKAPTPLARWLRSLLGFLRARIALALDTNAARVPDQLCRHEADLHVTTSEVVIHLSLTALPISIRTAGLDRDAGWIPAAGRSVRFVFS